MSDLHSTEEIHFLIIRYLNELIEVTTSIKEEIEKYHVVIKKHVLDSNISKTAGTSSGVVSLAFTIATIATLPIPALSVPFGICSAVFGGTGGVMGFGVFIGLHRTQFF
jgi:hypothetical protein